MLQTSPHPPVSLAPILDSASIASTTEPTGSANVTNAGITRAGIPVITLGNGDAFTYSKEMFTWLRLSESWWAVTSQYWDASGLKPPAGNNTQGTLGLVERRTDDEVLKMGRGRYLQRVLKATMLKEGFKGLETAVSVGHLEVSTFFSANLTILEPVIGSSTLTIRARISDDHVNVRPETSRRRFQ
jgi:protein HIRA/HIR1